MLRILKDAVELADGTPQGATAEIRDGIAGEREVQEEMFLRATQPSFFDRTTNRNVLTIAIRKQTAGLARSLYLSFMRRQTLTGTGALVVELLVGGTYHRYTAARAAWKQTACKPLGASVELVYQVTCGTFAYETDAAPMDDQVDGGDATDPMATTILLTRATRAEIQTIIGAEGFEPSEPWFETDGGRTGVGNLVINAAAKDLGTIAVTSGGTTTLAMASWATIHRAVVTVAAAGTYAHSIVIPQSVIGVDGEADMDFLEGDILELRVELEQDAGADSILRVYHDDTGGTALMEITADAATARKYVATYRHDGTQWREFDLRAINA